MVDYKYIVISLAILLAVNFGYPYFADAVDGTSIQYNIDDLDSGTGSSGLISTASIILGVLVWNFTGLPLVINLFLLIPRLVLWWGIAEILKDLVPFT